MNITEKRTETILSTLTEKHCAEYCSEYGESGYSSEPNGIIFMNWNDVSDEIFEYLEEAGYSLESNDEWYVDHDNDKAWRTSGDCYSWVMAIKFCDGYVLTPDDDISDWLAECESTDYNQPHASLPEWIEAEDIESNGYTKVDCDDYESGFYGTSDNPTKIYQKLEETVDGLESVVFQITSAEQFRVNFTAYYKAS